MLNRKYVHANVKWRWDGEDGQHITLLLPDKSGTVYFLNPTAAFIFIMCDGKNTVNDIVQLISERYKESADRVLRDVEAFLIYLEDLGLVRCTDVQA